MVLHKHSTPDGEMCDLDMCSVLHTGICVVTLLHRHGSAALLQADLVPARLGVQAIHSPHCFCVTIHATCNNAVQLPWQASYNTQRAWPPTSRFLQSHQHNHQTVGKLHNHRQKLTRPCELLRSGNTHTHTPASHHTP